MGVMKNITSTLTGLSSSLLLNVGLTRLAQKLDPVSAAKLGVSCQAISAEACAVPCNFTPQKGQ
jgi:hypothetical protein